MHKPNRGVDLRECELPDFNTPGRMRDVLFQLHPLPEFPQAINLTGWATEVMRFMIDPRISVPVLSPILAVAGETRHTLVGALESTYECPVFTYKTPSGIGKTFCAVWALQANYVPMYSQLCIAHTGTVCIETERVEPAHIEATINLTRTFLQFIFSQRLSIGLDVPLLTLPGTKRIRTDTYLTFIPPANPPAFRISSEILADWWLGGGCPN